MRLLAVAIAATALVAQTSAPMKSGVRLSVGVNKSLVVDTAADVRRVAVGNAEMAEATAIGPREVLLNGKLAGETNLVLWDANGRRIIYDVRIEPSGNKLEVVRGEMVKEFPGRAIGVEVADTSVFLRGNVKTLTEADRAASIAATLGKVVNLLRVDVPPAEPQILLRVRFANVDRSMSQDLGMNIFSLGKTYGTVTTGQFASVAPGAAGGGEIPKVTLADALNLFVFRSDINLGATIRALEAHNILQILAEPNLLTVSGKQANFLAGGEFPYPTLQGGGGGVGQVTVQFREFGVRIGFLPVITPRGSIRMSVAPEVSSLDFANGLTVSGYTIPGLATRRVQTEVELEDGQSFAIAGLLDNRVTESLSKIPGLSAVPLLGKLFTSRSVIKNNSELLVIVTPEIVQPMPRGMAPPSVTMPKQPLKGVPVEPLRTPGVEITGVPKPTAFEPVPVELFRDSVITPAPATPLLPTGQPAPFVPAVVPAVVPNPAPATPPNK